MAGVFLLSCAGLLFEIVLTRVFSATIWYHFTFIAISVALFGWGMGGFVLEFASTWARPKVLRAGLISCSLMFGVMLPVFLLLFLSGPCTPKKLEFYFGIALLPFLLGGVSLSAVFEIYSKDTNRLYFSDLMGAAAGTLLVPVLLGFLGAESTVLAIGVLPAAACFLFLLASPKWAPRYMRWICLGVLGILVALVVVNRKTDLLSIRNAPAKALYKVLAQDSNRKIAFDKWNAYSRITAVTGFDDYRYARLFIDSDAWTDVVAWDGQLESLKGRAKLFRYLPFRFHTTPNVLVIGPGGGADVRLALVARSSRITAVEMNPLIVEFVRKAGSKAGNIYSHPTVDLVLQEGRIFVKRTKKKFDVILLGFVDSWAAASSGGLSLTENYLYTSNAFKEYYDHLTENGTLVIIRWPSDIPRCVSNSVKVLREKGLSLKEIGERILAVSERKPLGKEPVATIFMLRKTPFPAEQVRRHLADFPAAHVFHAPHLSSLSPYRELLSGRMTLSEYVDRFPEKADPVTDDKPFYFARDKPYGVPPFMLRLLRAPVILVIIAMMLMIGWATYSPSVRKVLPASMVYFGMLGAGFILVEIALIHNLVLLLGHPVYALVVLLFFMLLWCSLGSLVSRSIDTSRIKRTLLAGLPLLVVLLVAALLVLPKAVQALMGYGIGVRIAASALMLAPIGFCMGVPFPLGLRQIKEGGGSIPIMWGVNGVMSVLGSILSMIIAVAYGLTFVFAAGALCYAVAVVPVLLWKNKEPT